MSLAGALALGLSGCGRGSGASHADAEVRALFAAVSADGRSHSFQRICRHEMWGVIGQLDRLVGGSCEQDLAAEWAEGVQLARVGPATHVIVKNNTATVRDGPSPDRAIRIRGRWLLAEFPKNRRHATPDGARETLDSVNRILRARHQRVNPETGALEDRQRAGPRPPRPSSIAWHVPRGFSEVVRGSRSAR